MLKRCMGFFFKKKKKATKTNKLGSGWCLSGCSLGTKLGGNVGYATKWYHGQLRMITAFMGEETSLNSQLSDGEWKWNGYGTAFHPSAVGVFLWSRGCFCRAGCLLGALGACWWGRGNFRFVCSSLCLFLPRSSCFVCLFVLRSGGWGKKMMEKWIYRVWRHISVWPSFNLSHVPWLWRRCSWNLSFQNSLSARQWAHYFNILDIYGLLTFPVVWVSSWRYFRNALPGIPKEMYNPVILNILLLKGLFF